jgi:uncharacterized protein (TIGR00369 family)
MTAAMTHWTDLLDRLVAGTAGEPPPFVTTLRLPPPSRWEPGRLWMDWEVDPGVLHERQGVFGGFIAALADSALSLVTMTVLNDGEAFTTSNLQVSFFRPAPPGRLQMEARVVHRGRTMVHAEATFTRADGKVAAVATATQVILREED